MSAAKNKDRWLAGATIIGFMIVVGAGKPTKESVVFQHMLQNPVVALVMIVLTLGTMALFIVWGRQPGHADRRALVTAPLGVGGLVALIQGLGPVIGWWDGPAFRAPLLMQALVYGVASAGTNAFFLQLYRWFARRRPKLALLGYLLLIVLMMFATILGDQSQLASGEMIFKHGYTIFSDVLYAVVFFGLPLIIYELMRHSPHLTNATTLKV